MSSPESVEQKEKEAVEFANSAVAFDHEQKHEASIYFYKIAAECLLDALKYGSKLPGLLQKAEEYISRAELLTKILLSSSEKVNQKSSEQLELERAEFLLNEALNEDENGSTEEAVDLYAEAVGVCLNARKVTDNRVVAEKLERLAKQALSRAEILKDVETKNATSKGTTQQHSLDNNLNNLRIESAHASSSTHISGSSSYTKAEIQVLGKTSFINDREYVPFMNVDLKEKFAYPIAFSDKDGKLNLSPKQKNSFIRWARPEDIIQNPKMVEIIDCFSIKQTVISDCSFVASLAISALYEKRFNKKLITSIIYPQNRSGNPVYNPCGKYMIKLHINGVQRKVIIDDYLPVDKYGKLLCSYSSNKSELWISLLEKAYMKVMGGYDFPGSNSNIDLHALTGWIPERVSIKSSEFNREAIFRKIIDRYYQGDVLVTLATGDIPESEADRAGLVPTHAYAMLDIKEVRGKRLFLLKNPWSHLRWKGNYSEKDTNNWTKSMRDALNYDPKSAQQFDNGVFWIDYDSICKFYDVFYLNWNPSLFKYKYCTHQLWHAGKGPAKDVYNIGENPQYSLNVKSTNSAIWILLTRHITDREDFANNKEYIAIMVYKNGGKKVFLPYDPPPYIDGTRINSPHYLCKIIIPEKASTQYTLVVSQYEKSATIYYSLRVFGTCPFSLNKLEDPYHHKVEITNGHWTNATAGGCANFPATFRNNPVYQLSVQSPNDLSVVIIDIKGPKEYKVGFEIVCVSTKNNSSPHNFNKMSCSVFRPGFNLLNIDNVLNGVYNIIPSTFYPGKEGPFFLTVRSSSPIKISKLH